MPDTALFQQEFTEIPEPQRMISQARIVGQTELGPLFRHKDKNAVDCYYVDIHGEKVYAPYGNKSGQIGIDEHGKAVYRPYTIMDRPDYADLVAAYKAGVTPHAYNKMVDIQPIETPHKEHTLRLKAQPTDVPGAK